MDEQNQNQNNLGDQLINILLSDGLGNGLVTIAQTLMNAAMLIEREQAPWRRASSAQLRARRLRQRLQTPWLSDIHRQARPRHPPGPGQL